MNCGLEHNPIPLLMPVDDLRRPITTYWIMDELAGGDAAAKVSAMKRAIAILVNGDSFSFRELADTIVVHVLPCEDRALQKLLLLYLEIVSKDADVYGRVHPDRTLICNHLRNSLEHRNEHVRCDTLRFLGCIRDTLLLEPLVPSVLANLYHPHAFVRRDAFSAVYAFCRLRKPGGGGKLLPGAPDIVERAIGAEQDAAAIRNAFMTLCIFAQERAAEYVLANANRVVSHWPRLLQMLAVNVSRHYRFQKRKVLYIKEKLVKTTQAGEEQLEETGAHGALLVQAFDACAKAFHACAKEHPDVLAPVLLDSLDRSAHDLFEARE
ncbi:hypothetical protein PR202_gb14370 [Eleusine coracana subsp. coracana]|uniref:Clathrin/coatomer adaptor adaptin-like N-terminal domain-containing protein n=1 Tax=Eleusine coracana subsp. coracana TaxID=191504 RepID=A0AAV5EV84_ELECO|nr:hypothetical protein PR202_gb14370 [Eleusine coracana subsp. coracana]